MDFPIADLLDDDACYAWLSEQLHPRGLRCPRCGDREMGVHRRRRAPVLDYRCKGCGAVFNAFTGTALAGTRMRPGVLVLVLRGFAQGATTARLARELGLNRPHLLALRHKLQAHALEAADRSPLPDGHVEGDEVYQRVGEKRRPAHRPRRPAAAAGLGGPGAGDLGQRPAAGDRGGGPGVGAVAAAGDPRRGGAARRPGGPGGGAARGGGVDRRVVGVPAAGVGRVRALDGGALQEGVGAGR